MAVPPHFWLALLAAVASGVGIWWARSLQLGAHRRSMRAFYTLSEQIFAAPSPVEIAQKLSATLPLILQATSVRLYLGSRRTMSLESVPTASDPEPMAVSLEGKAEGLEAGAVKCFLERTLINIPDVQRHSLVNAGWKSSLPRSVIFAPLLAQAEALGVIQVGNDRRLGYFKPEEEATLQHLANQVAASLKLEEQQAMREQLFRGEKLAATGQLISGVANDLRAPLERIRDLSSSILEAGGSTPIERDLKQLSAEAARASEIVSRLVSFARPAETLTRLVDVNALASGLIKFREPEWKTLGLRVQNRLSPQPALVLGVEGQIEEMFLNLLVSAEQTAARSQAKNLKITSSVIAGRVILEINYSDDVTALHASGRELNQLNAGKSNSLEFRSDEFRPDESRSDEFRPDESRSGESSPGQSSPGQSSPGESSPGQSGSGEFSPAETRTGEPKVNEPRLSESGPSDSNLGVCRAISRSHGGQLRVRRQSDGVSVDVDLPLAQPADSRPAPKSAVSRKVLTLMLVDAEVGAQRQLLGLLSARGHRVVPVPAEEAADLAHRLRFDGVLWALRPGDSKWSDFQERLRESIATFVLVSDGYDADLAASLQDSGGFLLGRPFNEAELERVLGATEARAVARA